MMFRGLKIRNSGLFLTPNSGIPYFQAPLSTHNRLENLKIPSSPKLPCKQVFEHDFVP